MLCINSKKMAGSKSIQQILFEQIQMRVQQMFTSELIKSIKTVKGNTQNSERVTILKIKEVLDSMSLNYKEASSQQSKDFRNVGDIGLDIEIKKTDSLTVYFNDTCPSADIYYIIIFTGKEYKNKKKSGNNIPPQICYLNGEDFLKNNTWVNDYVADLTALKDKYARGENKKLLTGVLSVYPRPTFKANISSFLSNEMTMETSTATATVENHKTFPMSV